MNERKDAIRDARTLGVPKMLLLGLQHMFAMFGATILVPILVNSFRRFPLRQTRNCERCPRQNDSPQKRVAQSPVC